nr:hypothetical protein [uncultured Prevotella sp.]
MQSYCIRRKQPNYLSSFIFSFIFFGAWQWYIVGIGTLFAMVYVGIVVKKVGKPIYN